MHLLKGQFSGHFECSAEICFTEPEHPSFNYSKSWLLNDFMENCPKNGILHPPTHDTGDLQLTDDWHVVARLGAWVTRGISLALQFILHSSHGVRHKLDST